MSFKPQSKGFATKAVHSGYNADMCNYKSVIQPIVKSSIFKMSSPGDYSGYTYSREGNPTRENLEASLVALEDAKYALTYSSGVGTVSIVMHMLTTGDHVIMGNDVYGGMSRYMREIAVHQGIETTFVDPTDLSEVKGALRPNTKVVWIESPSNPLLKVSDIEAIATVVHQKGKIMLAVDNTFMTPYFQRPLEHGADLVVYSLTKYMNGHSDVIMGSALTNDEEIFNRLKYLQYACGMIPSPSDCYLVDRSLKTLPLRMEQHQKSALKIAKYLEKHPFVEKVMHPGLPSHPQHKIALKQCYGHSGMISFYIKGSYEQGKQLLESMKVFMIAESLGGYESLISIPGVMTHACVPEEVRLRLGVTNNLIRLSVGLEDVDDLIQDLEQGFKAIQS